MIAMQLVLADAAPAAQAPADAPQTFFVQLVQGLPFVFILVMFYVLLILPQRKEQSTRKRMLDSLKKNDKVITIGGAIGVVADISADGDRVTLKFGDNTRIPFLRSSIQRILTEETDTKNETPTVKPA